MTEKNSSAMMCSHKVTLSSYQRKDSLRVFTNLLKGNPTTTVWRNVPKKTFICSTLTKSADVFEGTHSGSASTDHTFPAGNFKARDIFSIGLMLC